MGQSPKSRTKSRNSPTSQGAPARKSAKTAGRSATSGGNKGQARHRGQSARQNGQAAIRNGTKQAMLVELLKTSDGASVSEMAAKAGWQPHSVRGFLSGSLKKKLGLRVTSAQVEGRGRVYRIPRKS